MAIDGNYSVQKGDTLWGVAKQQLKAQGNEKPTNAQIVEAMNNIAQANGCNSPEECKDKFFNKIGSQLQVEGLFVEHADTEAQGSPKTGGEPVPVLSDKQKAQIEELRQLKYDSDQLVDKLKENRDIESYAQYLENNEEFQVVNSWTNEDGSSVKVYADKDGNPIGSVTKDANGKVQNASLGIQDGTRLSLNDGDGDGKIDNGGAVVIGKEQRYDENFGIRYNRVLNMILDPNDGFTVSIDEREDGTIAEHYFSADGKPLATAIKNSEDDIMQLFIDGEDGTHIIYNDIDGDGHVTEGEGSIRYDRQLDLSEATSATPPSTPSTPSSSSVVHNPNPAPQQSVNDRMNAILQQAQAMGFKAELVDDSRNV